MRGTEEPVGRKFISKPDLMQILGSIKKSPRRQVILQRIEVIYLKIRFYTKILYNDRGLNDDINSLPRKVDFFSLLFFLPFSSFFSSFSPFFSSFFAIPFYPFLARPSFHASSCSALTSLYFHQEFNSKDFSYSSPSVTRVDRSKSLGRSFFFL